MFSGNSGCFISCFTGVGVGVTSVFSSLVISSTTGVSFTSSLTGVSFISSTTSTTGVSSLTSGFSVKSTFVTSSLTSGFLVKSTFIVSLTFENFLENPSASNWNAMIPAMMWHQYWVQKAVYEVVEE